MSRRTVGFVASLVLGMVLVAMPASQASAANIVTATGLTIGPGQPEQTGALGRDGVPSGCSGVFKLEPGLDDSDPRRYRVHTFRNNTTNPICVTATFSSLSSCTIFSVGYIGGFDPADPLRNYAADMGSSSASQTSYSFIAGAGQPVAVVVHELAPGGGCGGYTLALDTDRPWAESVPGIDGAPALGSVLTGTDGNWADPAPALSRQWVRCNSSGSGCADIPGATGPTYTVGETDLGATLRFRNRATDAGGTSTAESRAVEPFIPFASHDSSLAPGDRAQNGLFARNGVESRCGAPTTAPAILQPATTFLYDSYGVSSLLNEAVCLTARAVPKSCGSGVTAQIYDPAFAPASGLATNYAGNSGAAFGAPNAVGAPLGPGQGREVVVSQGPAGTCDLYGVTIGADAPFATVRPSVGGEATVGGTLSAQSGTWSGDPALAYSWRRCDASGDGCTPIDGAAAPSYAPTAADAGSRLRVRVSATRGRTVSSDSPPSEIVAPPPPPVGGDEPADRDPPDATIVKVKRKGDDVKVKFRADEPGSTFECRLDRKAFKPCTSPKRYRNLKGGRHRVFVLATDAAGNEDERAAKARFKIRKKG